MNGPINGTDEYEYAESNWAMRHPSAVITLLALFLVFAQWVGGYWLKEQEAPQWEKIHKSVETLRHRDAVIIEYTLEQGRYVRKTLEAIALASGVKLGEPDEELTLSIARVRKIKNGGD